MALPTQPRLSGAPEIDLSSDRLTFLGRRFGLDRLVAGSSVAAVLALSGCSGGSGEQFSDSFTTASTDPQPSTTQTPDGDGDGDSMTTGSGDGDVTTEGGSAEQEGGDGDPDVTTDGGASKFDTLDDSDGGIEQLIGCRVLQVIVMLDNSTSMLDKQGDIAQHLPTFITTLVDDIKGYNPDIRYKIGFMQSSGYANACQWYHDPNVNYVNAWNEPCHYINQDLGVDLIDELDYNGPWTKCSSKLGAMEDRRILFDQNVNASFTHCSFAGGQPFIDSEFIDDDDQLLTEVSCGSYVGTGGIPYERPLRGLMAATDDYMIKEYVNTGYACNEGFFEEDAVTVIIPITDEDENHTHDYFGPWGQVEKLALQEQLIMNAGEGYPERVVVLPFVDNNLNHNSPNLPLNLVDNPDCDPNLAVLGENVVELAEGFPNRTCNSTHNILGGLMGAAAMANQACYDVLPQG